MLESPVTTPPVSFEGPWHLFLLLFLTSLFEELAFRKIPGDRLLPKHEELYLFASALLFGLAHWPGAGVKTVIVTFYLGLIWAKVYAKTRNLPLVVLLHILYNLLSGFLPSLLGSVSVYARAGFILVLLLLSVVAMIRFLKRRRACAIFPAGKEWRSILSGRGFWLYLGMLILSRILLQ